MTYQWKQQVVLVTGAATGIGTEIVKRIIEEDAKHVAILDINITAGIKLQDELNSKYGDNKTKFYECDVTNDQQFLGIFGAVKDEFGYIDVLVNNAGLMNDALNVYKKEIEVNVTAVVTGTLKAIEIMRKDKGGRGGAVINIASIAAFIKREMLPIYYATKSAVLQFSNCIGMDEYYSRTGVRVLTICFGATNTALLSPQKVGFFDPALEEVMQSQMDKFPQQTPEFAARGVADAFKYGKSASTWLVQCDKPAQDISSDIQKAYDILSAKLA